MGNFDEVMEKIFKAKKARRRELAQLSIEEKVRILIQLQTIASPILHIRGIKKEPWKI